MKLVFISDIHLNVRNSEDLWESSRFLKLADEIINLTPNKVVLLGDIFEHARPNLESEKAFYEFLNHIKTSLDEVDILIISGNHEVLGNGRTTFDYLPNINFTYYKEPVRLSLNTSLDLWLVGNNRLDFLKNVKQNLKSKQNILGSHIRCGMGSIIKPEIDFNNFMPFFDDIVLGDIHSRHFVGNNVQYTSQPYRTTYATPSDCGIVTLEVNSKSYTFGYHKLYLPSRNLLEVGFEDLSDVLKGLNKLDLYKIRVPVLLEQVYKLPKVPSNIRLEPIIQVEEVDRDEAIEEFRNSGRIDIVETLLRLSKQVSTLSERSMEHGENILKEILTEYKK